MELPKPGNLEHQFAPRFALNGNDAPHQIASLVPSLELGARATHFHHEVLRCDREPLLTGLAQHGLKARFKEALDGAKDFGPDDFCHYWPVLFPCANHLANL